MRRPVHVIKPRPKFALVDLRELIEYRDLMWAFAMRDLRLRYRQTIMGVAWVLLQPLIAAAAFAFVFGRVAGLKGGEVPYLLFAYVGMSGWTLFHSILSKSATVFTQNTALVSKVYFPRLLMPMSLCIGALVDFAISLVLLAVMMVVFSVPPTFALFGVLAIVPMFLCLALGCAFIVSSLAVSFRDVQHITPVLLNLVLYISPVGYSSTNVPSGLARTLFDLNPIAPLIEAFRYVFLGSGSVSAGSLAYAAGVSLAVFLVGIAVFSNQERRFADVI